MFLRRATRGTEAGGGIREFRVKRENAMPTGSKEVRIFCDSAKYPDSFDSQEYRVLRLMTALFYDNDSAVILGDVEQIGLSEGL